MTTKQSKVREDRLRRMAARQSLVLHKSRTRDKLATTYGGWMIRDRTTGLSPGFLPFTYSMSIDEVERYLTKGPAAQ